MASDREYYPSRRWRLWLCRLQRHRIARTFRSEWRSYDGSAVGEYVVVQGWCCITERRIYG